VITALDTNILSALFSNEAVAQDIGQQLGTAGRLGTILISAPVYSEILAHPTASIVRIDSFLLETRITIDYLHDPQIWLTAGLAYREYAKRRRISEGGEPKRVLIDFLIGAHASLHADCLLTLDRRRYERDFPELRLK